MSNSVSAIRIMCFSVNNNNNIQNQKLQSVVEISSLKKRNYARIYSKDETQSRDITMLNILNTTRDTEHNMQIIRSVFYL